MARRTGSLYHSEQLVDSCTMKPMFDIPLDRLGGLIDIAGRALLVIAVLGVVFQVIAAAFGEFILALAASTYMLGFALLGLVLMALGKLIRVVLEIRDNM